MTKHLIFPKLFAGIAMLALASPVASQDDGEAPPPSPGQIVSEAAAEEWIAIDPEDLIVMTLAPDANGNAREVVIQLMPAPFSEDWTANIRTFARSGWFDDITVNRVQDNYVVQWGDANYDNPESDGPPKALPEGLRETSEEDYTVQAAWPPFIESLKAAIDAQAAIISEGGSGSDTNLPVGSDQYADLNLVAGGWPIAANAGREIWPVHCYGMVGVGRNLSPDAGTGSELYTVIGHAPRHLDRNIALVGRIVEGIEHLSSLPRGKGQLGFYEDESKRTPILTVRVASDLEEGARPAFEYLDTEGPSFARYAEARANRRDPFFNVPAGGADVCNLNVPVRRIDE